MYFLPTADQLAHSMPEVRDLALENRAFLIRACRFLATSADIDQYLDCGSGLPTAENVHQVVHRIRREAKVVYSDHDPLVTAHGRALLDGLLPLFGGLQSAGVLLQAGTGRSA